MPDGLTILRIFRLGGSAIARKMSWSIGNGQGRGVVLLYGHCHVQSQCFVVLVGTANTAISVDPVSVSAGFVARRQFSSFAQLLSTKGVLRRVLMDERHIISTASD